MILKALYDYYHRSGDLAPYGYEKIAISYIVVIDKNGVFKNIESTLDESNKARTYIVPRNCGRTSNKKSNTLWDNGQYVFGLDDKDEEHKIFVKHCRSLCELNPAMEELPAIVKFYDNGQIENARQHPKWNEITKNTKAWISFMIKGHTDIIPVECKPLILEKVNNKEKTGYCLVTGKKGIIVDKTMGKFLLAGNNAHIVTFQTDSGYDSYGKSQCTNAPISKEAEFAITTALKMLFAEDSRNHCQIRQGTKRGTKHDPSKDRHYAFWSSSTSENAQVVEESFHTFCTKNKDKPNKGLAHVKEIFKSIWSGRTICEKRDRFYILGIAPVTKGRFAVSYWQESPLIDFAYFILKHFENMEIVNDRNVDYDYTGIYSILSAISLGEKENEKSFSPNLPDEILQSIVRGTQYPFSLYTACLRRIKAEINDKIEQSRDKCITRVRMAILKAYLNRLNNNDKNIEVMLDKQNTDAGYLCGRLFAVLDRKQEKASMKNGGSPIRTIRERYMNAASSTPVMVFPRAINLAKYYEDKLDKGELVFFEKLTQEILDKMPKAEFPSHLNLQEQGRFFIGYYQQRNELMPHKSNEQ